MKKDLSGQRYGKLTVLREVDPAISPSGVKSRRWLCRCDCGTEVAVLQASLTSGHTRSCGCSRRGVELDDLTGQRFGRLTVLSPAPLKRVYSNGQRTGWLCQCDCGRQCVCLPRALKSGETQSCGCLLADTGKDKLDRQNLTQRFSGTVVSTIRPDRGPNRNSKSGRRGVYWSGSEECWIAKIGFRGQSIMLGRFARFEDAVAAREKAEHTYFDPIIEAYDSSHDD